MSQFDAAINATRARMASTPSLFVAMVEEIGGADFRPYKDGVAADIGWGLVRVALAPNGRWFSWTEDRHGMCKGEPRTHATEAGALAAAAADVAFWNA